MEIDDILSISLCIILPFLAIWLEGRPHRPAWLSSIIICYGGGIVVSNLRLWEVDFNMTENLAGASMLLGLPLLLFAVRIKESIRNAGSLMIGFILCCLAGLSCTILIGYLAVPFRDDASTVAGMLVGLYTGGTPNVQAIGMALEAPANYVVLIQAADVILGGSVLLGLITFLPAFLSRWFPNDIVESGNESIPSQKISKPSTKKIVMQALAASVITSISIGFTYLLTGTVSHLSTLILLLTTLSLIVSASKLTEIIGNSYAMGEYFILVFSVALGLLADFRSLAADGLDLLYISAAALITTTLLHFLLCKWMKLDRDAAILSYVAGFYGPVFVVQVASSLKNKSLMAAGIATSLIGFGIGNYLGISVAFIIDTLSMYR